MSDGQRTMRVALIGHTLARWRTASGLLLDDLALTTGTTTGGLSRLLAGKRCVGLVDLGAISVACGAPDAERAEVVRLVEIGRQNSWTQVNHEELPNELNVLRYIETNARQVVIFNAQLVPELLQVPEYARYLQQDHPMAASRSLEHQAVLQSPFRVINRQKLSATRWLFLIHENALNGIASYPHILRKQVDHLLLIQQQPNVTVQIVPASTQIAAGGHAFYLCDFDDQPDAVCLLHVNAATVFETDTVVDAYRQLATVLHTTSMDTAKTHTFLTSLTTDL